MAAFTDDKTLAFLLGVWTKCVSSNVRWSHYDAESWVLTLGFDGGDQRGAVRFYEYEGVDLDMAEDFAAADSKGKWRWKNLPKTWPYREIGNVLPSASEREDWTDPRLELVKRTLGGRVHVSSDWRTTVQSILGVGIDRFLRE